MMAAVILTVGFMGLIQAVTICSGMMDQARRQTLAAQILTHEIEQLRLANWKETISVLPTAQRTVCSPWVSGRSYLPGDSISYSNKWYRCIVANAGITPTNLAYWKVDSPPYAAVMNSAGLAYGASYVVNRSVNDFQDNLREVTFTITWTVTTSRKDSSGNLVTFTSTRINSAYFGKYGLNLSYQRS